MQFERPAPQPNAVSRRVDAPCTGRRELRPPERVIGDQRSCLRQFTESGVHGQEDEIRKRCGRTRGGLNMAYTRDGRTVNLNRAGRAETMDGG